MPKDLSLIHISSKEQMRRRSDFSSLCRGFIVPQEIRDTESVTLFLDAAEPVSYTHLHGILDDLGFLLAVVAFELREVLKAQARCV